jgi:glycosyltransferase involved in cell wall biosynthesis
MQEPLVSVVLPVHDGETHIAQALESALQQTYRNLEVIVIDDGSRDGTLSIVETRAAGDRRVRVVSQSNQGVASARNRGLAVARGDLVAPLDSDDVWEPTKVERQVRRITEAGHGTGLVYCWWAWIDADGAILDRSPGWRIEGHAHEALLEVNYTGNASVPLYRREAVERAGGYDDTLRARDAQGCEDWDLALKVAERCRVAVVPAVLIGYRRRAGSMSARIETMWRSHALVLHNVRQRRPDLRADAIRRSRDQFALYLAGISFWSGNYRKAIGWGVRGGRSGVAFRLLPHVIRLLSRVILAGGRNGPEATRQADAPGANATSGPAAGFAAWNVVPPLIPYDRLYRRRFRHLLSE